MTVDQRSTSAFFRYFFAAYPGRSILMISLLILAGLLEGVSVLTLLPLLEVASAEGGLEASSDLGRAVASAFYAVGLEPSLWILAGLVVTGITAKAIFIWLGMREVGYTVARVTLDLRLQLVRAVLRARWRYFGGRPLGQFATSITSEAVRSAAAYQEACVVLAGVVQVAVYVTISTLISWQVTLVAIILGTLLLGALRGFVAITRAAGQEQTDLTKSLTSRLMDALQGIKPMKAMAREDLFWPLLRAEAQGLNQAHRKRVLASESLRLFQEPVLTLFMAFGLVVFLTLTDRPFASIVVLAFIFYRLMKNISTLQMRYQIMTVGESAFWSLREQIDEAEKHAEVGAGTLKVSELRERIEFHQVQFAYDNIKVLHSLNMTIPAGRLTALIGQSGSGKTTILDLVTGLQRPDSGEILVDGVPLADVDIRTWRNAIGYVPQDVFLFHDTVRRNVTLGDESISDDRVVKALKDADAWSFVARDSAGIDAVISPQGSNLSGGQRQRLAIARALVKNPTLLIMDEATTGLDTTTEAEILETLRRLRGKVTILAVSHQPALRDAADATIELVDGEIVGEDQMLGART